MAATASAIQILANRANAQLSTGPRADAGKLSASTNALSHGLTSRHALLPGEDPGTYSNHHAAYTTHYRGTDADPLRLEAIVELADITWRLKRVPAFEAQLITAEVARLQTDPELAALIKGIEDNGARLLALAFSRLVASRVLPNLFNQESRLARRAEKLRAALDSRPRFAPRQAPPPQVIPESEPHPEPEIEPELESEPQIENQKIEPNSPIVIGPKTGRNDSCPCGSGLKFKRCCLNKGVR